MEAKEVTNEKYSAKKIGIQDYPKPQIDFSPKIPPLKSLADKTKVNIRYALIPPFAFAHIYWNPKISELVYETEEPYLNEWEKKYLDEITNAMENMVNFGEVIEKNDDLILEYIDRMLKILLIELGIDISYESYKKIYYYLARDFIGLNEVEPLLRDYFVEDIECNGAKTPIYIVHRAYRNIKT